MIHFLARLFRQIHGIVGITAPPEGTKDRKVVLIWLIVLVVILVWCAALLYLMLYVF